MKKITERLKNPITWVGIAGYILTIASTLGFKIDNNAVMTIIQSICAILVLLGILNKPKGGGNAEK